ncbi:type II secretion system minor pseudopilin GspK [Citreimonas sp.]|uniref:type II secretion system minor pseudopilin GspK n=1 Tax=Citreimonas sp. TaxID=3036715 RepID=UPI0035C826C3
MRARRGFVLVNALVLVAALSAAALMLLGRAETGRARLQAGGDGDRLALAAGAFEALAQRRLAGDAPVIDHDGELWAAPAEGLALDPGIVSGTVTDMQGRFNINWLADPADTAMRAAFDRLVAALGLPPSTGDRIAAFVRPGASDPEAWRRLDPPLAPVGGSVLLIDQLREVPGLSSEALERLEPYVTALPGDSLLNVNTAPGQVLSALMPDMPPTRAAQLLQRRARNPFADVDAFLAEAGLGSDDDTIDPARLTVGSSWFLAHATLRLGDRATRRRTMLHRPAPGQVSVAWRIETRP